MSACKLIVSNYKGLYYACTIQTWMSTAPEAISGNVSVCSTGISLFSHPLSKSGGVHSSFNTVRGHKIMSFDSLAFCLLLLSFTLNQYMEHLSTLLTFRPW